MKNFWKNITQQIYDIILGKLLDELDIILNTF